MRVWDIHPGYLSRQRLLGHHAEIHGVYSVITEQKAGYANHPETRRWKGHIPGLCVIHNLAVSEMKLRGFRHHSPLITPRESVSFPAFVDAPEQQFLRLEAKYLRGAQRGRIPLPRNGSELWAQHKYQVMARSYRYYKEIQAHLKGRPEASIQQQGPLTTRLLEIIRKPPTRKAFSNMRDHLWGYFKNRASDSERAQYLKIRDEAQILIMAYLYELAKAYEVRYLIEQTVFCDLSME